MARDAVIASAARPTASLPTFAGVRAWIVLGTLWFVYVLNFLDRQLLAILAKPIQDSLRVSDRRLGLIGGLYFALFYCFIAIPVGNEEVREGTGKSAFGCPPGIRTPICCSRGSCPTIERGGNAAVVTLL